LSEQLTLQTPSPSCFHLFLPSRHHLTLTSSR